MLQTHSIGQQHTFSLEIVTGVLITTECNKSVYFRFQRTQ